MDGVASAAMKSDNVALGFDEGANEKGGHRRTALLAGKKCDCCLFQFMGFLSRTNHTDTSGG